MCNLFWMAAIATLVACGDSTGGSDGQRGVLDRMFLYNPEMNFAQGDRYVFANYWRAYDGVGAPMSLDTSDAKTLGIRYSLGDSLAPQAAVDSTGAFTLKVPFTGFLYVFAPTERSSLERLGRHYLTVIDTLTGF